MPIIVDPGATNPPPPTQVTSPDGVLTATVDEAHGGILLEADFSPRIVVPPQTRVNLAIDGSFNRLTTQNDPTRAPSTGGNATVSIDSTWGGWGSQSVKITPDGAGSASSIYPWQLTNAVENVFRPGHTYTVGATIHLEEPQAGTLDQSARMITVGYVDGDTTTYNDVVSDAADNAEGDTRLTVTFTVPADVDGGFVRLMNGSPTTPVWWDGLVLEEGTTDGSFFNGDFAATDTWVYRWVGASNESASIAETREIVQVRFVRADGTPVRGGDPAPAPGGHAVAYDHEAPLDTAVAWQAIPIYADGSLGTPSQQVAIQTPGVPQNGGPLCHTAWVKCIDDPGASLALNGIEPLPTFTRSSRAALQAVPGTRYPAGVTDVSSSVVTSLNFLTLGGRADVRALNKLYATGSVLFVQWATEYGEDDRYFLVTGDLTRTPFGTMRTGKWRWSVEVTEVARPATVDSVLFIPGRSYAETAALAPTYDQRASSWPTYADVWAVS